MTTRRYGVDSNDDGKAERNIVDVNMSQQLKDGDIVADFVASKKTKCIIVQLNAKYEKKNVISTIYSDWIKTIDKFTTQAKAKGVSDAHILLLTDTLDNNHEEIMSCILDGAPAGDIDYSSIYGLELIKQRIREAFLDEVKTPYATIKVDDHIETMPIDSTRFEDWAGATYYYHQKSQEDGGGPMLISKEEIAKIQSILKFESMRSSIEGQTNIRPLHLRIAAFVDPEGDNMDDNVVYYDLCDPKWEIVKITCHGWTVEKHSEPLFKRYPINNPQVHPSEVYSPDIMDKFIGLTNIKNDADNALLAKVYLISVFILENLPKPLLTPYGIKGSAKSTFQEFLKLIIDPSAALTTVFPKSIEELIQALAHSYVIFFDNVSRITELTSDQLCRAVTGGGFTKRGLYTNDDDYIYNMRRSVGYNGINIAATKSDLLDRMLTIHLTPINKKDRKKISTLRKEFDSILPELLGYIFDTIVQVLKRLGEVKLNELPRMADFAEIGELIARCLGYPEGKFTEVYSNNIGFNNVEAVNASPIATAIMNLMNTQAIWTGKTHELLLKLNELVSHKKELAGLTTQGDWPKNARGLAERINEIIPNMREVGIIIDRVYDAHAKSDTITIVNNNYSPPEKPAEGESMR